MMHLSDNQRLVLSWLDNNFDGGKRQQISEAISRSEGAVKNCLDNLRAKGLVEYNHVSRIWRITVSGRIAGT